MLYKAGVVLGSDDYGTFNVHVDKNVTNADVVIEVAK